MINRCLIRHPEHESWLHFTAPVTVLVANQLEEVLPTLSLVETGVEQENLHAVGFVCYEAAGAFDPALSTRLPVAGQPLLAFALFNEPTLVSDEQLPAAAEKPPVPWRLDGNRDAYLKDVQKIRDNIANGNVYQINHTLQLRAAGVDPWSLFRQMAGDAAYACFLESEAFAVVSASPELFFALDGERLTCQPMKGTAARGVTRSADHGQRDWLVGSTKNRAENLMITDMVRNDLGRIARPGSVQTTDLFKVQAHPTVWQMTSEVSATTDASICEIFTHLFPGASITGAPKNASMRMIEQLETRPRGIYTGAIGHLQPGRRARFSIAIRTAWINKAEGEAVYGAGGGIVWDSDPEEEFAELLSKTRILKPRPSLSSFQLLETLLWQPDPGYVLLEEHLQRLAASAGYFGFECRLAEVRQRLDEYSAELGDQDYRIRLLVDRVGRITLESQPMVATSKQVVALQIFPEPVDTADPMLYHKTSYRKLYERAQAWAEPGHEALLVNPEGFLTESPIANLVYELAGDLFTPPLSCGLLPGTLRASLLKAGKISERPLHRSELQDCGPLWLINSLRGWRCAEMSGEAAKPTARHPD